MWQQTYFLDWKVHLLGDCIQLYFAFCNVFEFSIHSDWTFYILGHLVYIIYVVYVLIDVVYILTFYALNWQFGTFRLCNCCFWYLQSIILWSTHFILFGWFWYDFWKTFIVLCSDMLYIEVLLLLNLKHNQFWLI
jgi:hypothetical protein